MDSYEILTVQYCLAGYEHRHAIIKSRQVWTVWTKGWIIMSIGTIPSAGALPLFEI